MPERRNVTLESCWRVPLPPSSHVTVIGDLIAITFHNNDTQGFRVLDYYPPKYEQTSRSYYYKFMYLLCKISVEYQYEILMLTRSVYNEFFPKYYIETKELTK